MTLDYHDMVEALEPVFNDGAPWQRLYVDLPGHGMSAGDAEIKSQDDVLERLLAFVDARFGGQPFGIIRYSRGSYLADGLIYKRRSPVLGAA